MVKYRRRRSHPAVQQFPTCVCSVVLQVYSGNSNISFTREAVGAAHAQVSPQFTSQKCEGGAMTIASVFNNSKWFWCKLQFEKWWLRGVQVQLQEDVHKSKSDTARRAFETTGRSGFKPKHDRFRVLWLREHYVLSCTLVTLLLNGGEYRQFLLLKVALKVN